jgi:hypothetical protein
MMQYTRKEIEKKKKNNARKEMEGFCCVYLATISVSILYSVKLGKATPVTGHEGP